MTVTEVLRILGSTSCRTQTNTRSPRGAEGPESPRTHTRHRTHIFTLKPVYCKHRFTLTGTPTFSLGSEQFPAAFNCTSSVPVSQTPDTHRLAAAAYLAHNPCVFYFFKAPCSRFPCKDVSQLIVHCCPALLSQNSVANLSACFHHVLSVSGGRAKTVESGRF